VLAEYGITARVLNGFRTCTVSSFFDEFALRLDFPDYFGHNWSALKDCLVDLAWLPGFAYVLVIYQSRYLLQKEEESKTASFVRVIESAAKEWAAPISLGEDWDRPAIPFHLVLQETPDNLPLLRTRFQQLGVDLPDLTWDLSLDPRAPLGADDSSGGERPSPLSLSQQGGEAGGSLIREAPGRAGAAPTKPGRVSTAR
jgi:RNAse (barnase) inhibitor barstar